MDRAASIQKNFGDILSSVYEGDHVTGDACIDKRMRGAATDLDFEDATRLRDKFKRFKESERAIYDPLARQQANDDRTGSCKGPHGATAEIPPRWHGSIRAR